MIAIKITNRIAWFAFAGIIFLLSHGLSQAAMGTVGKGSHVTFSITVDGTPPFTYQWEKDGVPLPGQSTGSTYVLPSAQVADSGNYTVMITNSLSTIQSDTGVLTVTPAIFEPDFSADGYPDIIWEKSDTGDRAIWFMNGISIGSFGYIAGIPTDWHIVGTGDFNGDGQVDLVWENLTTGDRTVWFMNPGDVTIAGFGYFAQIDAPWHIAAVADMDGDGQPDLVWENTATGDRTVWLMNGTTIGSMAYLANVPTEWHIVGAGDFNGDGQTDIVWEDTVTGDRSIWLMNGTTISSFAYVANVDPAWHIASVADYDGDGNADLLWENTATGDRAFWLFSGVTVTSEPYLAGVDGTWNIVP